MIELRLPSFETPPTAAPQDEERGFGAIKKRLILRRPEGPSRRIEPRSGSMIATSEFLCRPIVPVIFSLHLSSDTCHLSSVFRGVEQPGSSSGS
jgi:hypothetical protein